jgi:hypothetical protein
MGEIRQVAGTCHQVGAGWTAKHLLHMLVDLVPMFL